MTGNAPSFAKLLLQIFLPFAFAYFLSYIFRGVNAVIFPYLEHDIGITAGDLGLLTSAFFLFFAGCLMAAIKIFTLWYPPQRWGLITGFHMMAGGAGSMAATLPVQWSLSFMSWQGLFFWLAGICLATSALIF